MNVVHFITRLIIGGAQENTLLTVEDQHRLYGDAVSLTATVSPSNAKGRVEFQWSSDDGKTWNTFASSALSSGRAKIVATPGGELHYRAVFKPTDPLAFLTSNATVVQQVVELADMRADIDSLLERVAKLENPPA